MQAEMLDSIVSSNSQALFDFKAEHNGEACIESLRPEDARTPNAFRFTIAMLCAIYSVPKQTMHNNIDSLLEDEEIAQSDILDYAIPGGNNRTYETALYNLNVLNRLGMCCFRKNKEAKRVRDKFNDVLIKHETQVQPELTDAEIMSRALEIAHRTLALREERIKALESELTSEKEAHEKDNEDFRNGLDIINAQKAQIVSTREATAMATASVKSRECKRLTAENAELKDAVGRGKDWHTVNMMTAEWKREFGHAPSWQKLKEYSADLPKEMKPVRDVEVKVVLHNGSEKISKVFRYHREAWAKYREYEEDRRAKDKNVPDTKILDLSATDTEVEYF